MIQLYASNDLNCLVQKLGDLLYTTTKKNNLLTPHTIIVQSLGMQRWISLSLARQHGVFFNCEFPFPQKFAQDVFKAVIPDYELSPLYDAQWLVWLIMDLLPQCLDDKVFKPVQDYLQVDGIIHPVRLFHLAQKLAYMYDEYIVYFYEDILKWDDDKGPQSWQVQLWNFIKNRIDSEHKFHKAHILDNAVNAIKNPKNKQVLTSVLPQHVFIFGITMLPAYYITLFDALSTVVNVHIFQLNPSKEYWFDIQSEHTIRRIKQKIKNKNINFDDLHFEAGNPLLASFGKVGQEYIGKLLDKGVDENIHDDTNYRYIHDYKAKSTLLALIQSDICNCINRDSQLYPKLAIPADDRSISIHSCHSPLREVEVLRDYILDIMNSDDVLPNDIVVMAPDIDVYAPFIKAVFDEKVLQNEKLPVIPYCIADQSYRNESRFISAFCDLLELLGGRLEVDTVCTLLDYDEVAHCFGIEKNWVMEFNGWIRKLNVRWGKDSEHRKQFTKINSNAFTWDYALERLLMGYAVPQSAGIVDDVIPFDCVEGTRGFILGNIINFLQTLFAFFDEAQNPKDIENWSVFLQRLTATMLDVETHPKDYEAIQSIINSLEAIAPHITLQSIPFIVIKDWLTAHILEQKVGSNFLSRGITFCQILPMRSIPFKVMCLLGMNDGDFPRLDEIMSFDILRNEVYKKKMLRCVRSKRNDDRYLFLESIISAQKYLFISYQGQSPVDLSIKEPSMVVNELLEYIEKGYYIEDQTHSIRDYLITKHHMHHFHSDYFDSSSTLYSYSPMWLKEAKSLFANKTEYTSLAMDSIPAEYPHILSINEFTNFFLNPCRYFIMNVLGIRLYEDVPILESNELLEFAGLKRYFIQNEMARHIIEGGSFTHYSYYKKKECAIPDSILGDVIMNTMGKKINRFARTVTKYYKEPQPVDIIFTSASGITLTGSATLCSGPIAKRQVFYRYASPKPHDRLKAFLWHLIVSASLEEDIETYFIGSQDNENDSTVYMYKSLPKNEAIQWIEKLIHIFKEGNTRILPFFPETSYVYYKEMQEKHSNTQYIIYRLEDTFYNASQYSTPEYADPYINRAFYKVDIFNNEKLFEKFKQLAQRIYQMVRNCEIE